MADYEIRPTEVLPLDYRDGRTAPRSELRIALQKLRAGQSFLAKKRELPTVRSCIAREQVETKYRHTFALRTVDTKYIRIWRTK